LPYFFAITYNNFDKGGYKMTGFVSGRGNSVVLRSGRDGWVWGFKAARAGDTPAPSAFFVPFADFGSASRRARQWSMAGVYGFVVVVVLQGLLRLRLLFLWVGLPPQPA
jgi:hypothetical protein